MSASGKSSNRRYEEGRGWNGGGHGIYADMGKRERHAYALRTDTYCPVHWTKHPRSQNGR